MISVTFLIDTFLQRTMYAEPVPTSSPPVPNQRLPVRLYALANEGSWRAGFSESVMIANTRVVTLDVRLSALSRQSVRLVHVILAEKRIGLTLGCPARLSAGSEPG